MPSAPAVTAADTLRALALANLRYWTSVHRLVRTELRHWERRAAEIPDETWRTIACDKLTTEQFNAQVAATLATLAPRALRAPVVRAIVAAEVLYDYLDGASEHTNGDRQLYDAFATAVGNGDFTATHYFAALASDDDGYLHQLAETCRDALARLPAATVVAPAAQQAADRCATAQTLTHRIPEDGPKPLQAWAETQAHRHDLAWWEFAAGGAASILAVHALIAAAASPTTTPQDAAAIGNAYLLTCALSTLLDSLVDHERDQAAGTHSFTAYYANDADRARGIATVAGHALAAAAQLPKPAHHAMTVAGVAGYYLSADGASSPYARRAAAAVERELSPALGPILAIFAMWRLAKRLRALRRQAPPEKPADR